MEGRFQTWAKSDFIFTPRGGPNTPKSPKMPCIQQKLPLHQLLTRTWDVLYCSRIRSNNLFCLFEFIGEIGSLVGPITPVNFMLDTLEVRTSLLDPNVYNTPYGPPKYVKQMPKNQHFGSYLPMFDILTITIVKQHENTVEPHLVVTSILQPPHYYSH